MTLETFYGTIEGDYAGTKSRFMTEERMLRFINRFPADGSFALLKQSLADGNTEEAFRAAHTLKGVAQNLGFTALFERASTVTEALRAGNRPSDESVADLENYYNLVMDSIASIG